MISFRRIFLPKDNQVLTLVLGGESALQCAIFNPRNHGSQTVGMNRYPSSEDG